MNEILWLDDDNLPYTVRSPGDILRVKNGGGWVYLGAPIPVACRGDIRVYLHYLQERYTIDDELHFELDIGDDNNTY